MSKIIATHKRCGKTHEITEIIEETDVFIHGIVDGIEGWIGKESYDFKTIDDD